MNSYIYTLIGFILTILVTARVLYILYTNRVTTIVEIGIITLLLSLINRMLINTSSFFGFNVVEYTDVRYEVISMILILFGLIIYDDKKRKT